MKVDFFFPMKNRNESESSTFLNHSIQFLLCVSVFYLFFLIVTIPYWSAGVTRGGGK
jgi:hypothetical protein